MTIKSGITLGGAGATLVALSAVTSLFTIVRYLCPNSVALNSTLSAIGMAISLLSLIGFVLFLVSMFNFSRAYSEHKIFKYLLYGIVLNVIAGAITSATMLAFALADITRMYAVISPTEIPAYLLGSISPYVPIFGLVSLIYLVFMVQALRLLGKKTQDRMFNKSGIIFLVSAVVQIVAGVVLTVWASIDTVSLDLYSLAFVPGGLVQSVAWAVLAKAFYRIAVPPSNPITVSSQAYTTEETEQPKHCPNCNTENSMDSIYCVKCGKKL